MSASQPQLSRDPPASCLAASAAIDLAAGRLAADDRARAERHIEDCPACEFVVATAREQHALHMPEAGSSGRVGMLLAQRYRLSRLAGRGGMGEVFEAHDELLDARIAVKCLASRWASSASAQQRLKREVLLARRVSHPNVARVYDFGSHRQADDKPVSFLTMEFVDGGSLRQRVAGQPLPPERVLSIVQQLLLALAQAHRVGVLHRDLKSDNILVRDSQPGEEPSVVVTDFGLARAITRDGSHVSASQLLLGTPGYLAPEQIQGGRLTVRTDLYSLGVVSFELLTGHLPFIADTPLATAIQRLQRPAPRVSASVAGVPHAWDEFVARCLERDPARRFAGAEQAYASLLALLNGLTNRQARRSRSLASVPSLVLGALLGAALDPLCQEVFERGAAAGGAAMLSRPAITAFDVPHWRADVLRSAPFVSLAGGQFEAGSAVVLRAERDERIAQGAAARSESDSPTQPTPPDSAGMTPTLQDGSDLAAHDFIDPFATNPE